MTLKLIRKDLRKLADKDKASHSQRYFKTGKGEYAEGDLFLGVNTPDKRNVAKKYSDTNLKDLEKLLQSKYHDERQVALYILIDRNQKHYKRHHNTSPLKDVPCTGVCKDIYELYIKNVKHINNWDLVDISAHKIVGRYLENKDRGLLYEFANSNHLWKKRISIITTFWYIKDEDYHDALKISEILLQDKHDLIHKAVGWVLREVGKKDREVEERFLRKHYKKMPRTMLRYAIEKFPEELRQKYLKGTIK